MEIELKRLVIHELIKQSGENTVELKVSHILSALNEEANVLIQRLTNTLFEKEDTLNGVLESAEESPFPKFLQQLVGEPITNETFLDFTQETMQTLKLGLQGVTAAKGGYFVFAEFDRVFQELGADWEDEPGDPQHFLAIFLVRDTDGLIFNRGSEDQTYKIQPTTYLNIEKLAMAAQIDVNKYLKEEQKSEDQRKERYVKMIKHAKTQKEISEYFITWIGLEQGKSNRDLSNTFVEIVHELPRPVNQETGEVMNDHEFLQETHAFLKSNPDGIVQVREYEQHFFGEETPVQDFATQNDLNLDTEFKYNKGVINSLNDFKVNGDGVNVKFSREHLRDGVIFTEGDTLVIHSPDLVDAFLEALSNATR